jgi:hypothetical protein
LNGLSITNKNKIVGLLNGFHNEIKNKWLLTCSRNLNEDTFGINGLFKKLQIFDPFKKFQLIQDFNYYKNLFLEVSDEKDLTSIENEFSEYLSDAAPDNLDIETLNFWFSSQHNYPNLSKIAINFLCIPCGSCDAESSFRKIKRCEYNQKE